jgi:hypothetical protein
MTDQLSIIRRPAGATAPDDTGRHAVPLVSAFFKLAEAWRLNQDQQAVLLGGPSRGTLANWKKGRPLSLSRDQLDRISLVFGIHKGLALLFADSDGRARWLNSANSDPPFDGLSPLGRMLAGGIGDLMAVRRYIDAWRGVK